MRRLGFASLLLPLVFLAGCLHHRVTPKVSLNPLTATPKTIDSLWNLGLEYYRRHKWEKAATAFDRAELELPPGDHRILQGRLYLGELYVRSGSNLQGVREYRRLVDEFPTDSLAPEALLAAADAYFRLWRRPELDPTYGLTAQSVYSEVLTRYPNAPAAAKARAELAELDNRFALKEYQNARYYLKFRAYDSAILYYTSLVADHPKAAIVPKALADLISAYRKLGYADDIHDKCEYMARNWSATPEYKTACLQAPATTANKAPAKTPPSATVEKPTGR
jgi:outer membrane assembly lipoprotein YfiO